MVKGEPEVRVGVSCPSRKIAAPIRTEGFGFMSKALPKSRLGLRQCEPEIYPAPTQFMETPQLLVTQSLEPSKHKGWIEGSFWTLTALVLRFGYAPSTGHSLDKEEEGEAKGRRRKRGRRRLTVQDEKPGGSGLA